jgi:hypothetical protein
MIKSNIISILVLVTLFMAACSKGPGPGGRSSIKGKVWGTNLGSSLSFIADSGWVGNQDVFISYGDNTSVGDKLLTSYDGSFEFLYLRPGNYKVCTYSKELFGINKLDSAVVKDVLITDKGEAVDLGTIRIYTDKN